MSQHNRRIPAVGLGAALMLCALTLPAAAAVTLPPGPVPAVFTSLITIAAGASSTSMLVATVPAGRRLVVQSVSIYRSLTVTGSVLSSFLPIPVAGGQAGYIALPEITADGTLFPSTTIATTAYFDAKASLNLNVYRTGSDTNAETDSVTIVGYYVAPE